MIMKDILSTIYDGLQQSSTIKEQKIYAIYPSIDELLIIRNLANGAREYFPKDELDKFIQFNVQISK